MVVETKYSYLMFWLWFLGVAVAFASIIFAVVGPVLAGLLLALGGIAFLYSFYITHGRTLIFNEVGCTVRFRGEDTHIPWNDIVVKRVGVEIGIDDTAHARIVEISMALPQSFRETYKAGSDDIVVDGVEIFLNVTLGNIQRLSTMAVVVRLKIVDGMGPIGKDRMLALVILTRGSVGEDLFMQQGVKSLGKILVGKRYQYFFAKRLEHAQGSQNHYLGDGLLPLASDLQ